MNSTLYPFGARLRDGCTVYECQNRDNCGKFVPVEWGKFFTTTKYGNIRYTLYPMFFFYLKFAYNTVFKRTYFGLSVYCNFLFYNKVVTGWIDAMDQETNGSQIEAVLFLPAQCTRNQMGTSTW